MNIDDIILEQYYVIKEDINNDINKNKIANKIGRKVLSAIISNRIRYELISNDIIKTNKGDIKLKGIKFNLNQIDNNYNIEILFCESIRNLKTEGGFDKKNNRLLFFIFDRPYVNYSQFPEDRIKMKDEGIQDYIYYLKNRFKSWVLDEGLFTHEFIHYLDSLVYSDNYRNINHSTTDSYYNSPEEYNAMYHEILSHVLKNIKRFKGLTFNNFIKNIIKYDKDEKDKIKNLNNENLKKLKIRLYKFYNEKIK